MQAKVPSVNTLSEIMDSSTFLVSSLYEDLIWATLTAIAGDLLRAEQQRAGSTYGAMIKEYITEGKIVPMEVTVKVSFDIPLKSFTADWLQLLENAMRDTLKSPPTFSGDSALGANWQGGRGRFLIDGFPRKMDQAIKFDESVSCFKPV
jgi:UMP-CMP kinase